MTEKLALSTFTEKAYLDYAMYVILDRALPHLGDGLKPVQRRIIYAMSELGLKNSSKHKKSARTVGDVLGKYHPHGDSACYEAMVLMAQPFSYRYPFIDGQGNWGAPDDPKSFAAMRYTEARLSAYAELLLKEMDQGTVEWLPNFDGSLEEPKLLPAQIPNVLLNGGSGIAVGMATDIPPHNLSETLAACIHLLDHPNANLDDLMSFIQGPDFPTGGEIISSKSDIRQLYESGNGQVRARAEYQSEKRQIAITALPYQVSGTKLITQIAAQMREKKLPWVEDIRDESDEASPVRIVLTLRSARIDTQALMSHLFATTDLERTYRVNFNVISLDGKPQVMPLVDLLNEWLIYRKQTVRSRLQNRLDYVNDRLHVLDGLLAAYLNVDEIIALIRQSDQPKLDLMAAYQLSERQAQAILELRLRQLAKLEQIKIEQEQLALNQEKATLEKTLSSDARLKSLIRKELKAISQQYGDHRRSSLIERDRATTLSLDALTPSEPICIVLSKQGWIRLGKGDIEGENLPYKAGDAFKLQVKGKSNQHAVLFDNEGKAFTIATNDLPSARGYGEPLTGRININTALHFDHLLLRNNEDLLLLATSDGYGFIAPYQAFLSKTRNGKQVINKISESALLTPCPLTASDQYIACLSSSGRILFFPMEQVAQLNRGKGTKLMSIKKQEDERLVTAISFAEQDSITLLSGKRKMTFAWKDIEPLISARGKRGSSLPRGFSKANQLLVSKKS